MASLLAFFAGVFVCVLIWLDGERVARNERIRRARLRDHSTVPSIK